MFKLSSKKETLFDFKKKLIKEAPKPTIKQIGKRIVNKVMNWTANIMVVSLLLNLSNISSETQIGFLNNELFNKYVITGGILLFMTSFIMLFLKALWNDKKIFEESEDTFVIADIFFLLLIIMPLLEKNRCLLVEYAIRLIDFMSKFF